MRLIFEVIKKRRNIFRLERQVEELEKALGLGNEQYWIDAIIDERKKGETKDI